MTHEECIAVLAAHVGQKFTTPLLGDALTHAIDTLRGVELLQAKARCWDAEATLAKPGGFTDSNWAEQHSARMALAALEQRKAKL